MIKMKIIKGSVWLSIMISLVLSVLASPVFAGDITFKVNQSDYFFLTGQNAIVPIEMNNTYGMPMSGMFTYTLTQEVRQGGMFYSSSNTQTKSFNVPDGDTIQYFGFGSANSPTTIKADFRFDFNDGSDDRFVKLDTITIHFISNSSQQNQQQTQSSQSQQQSGQQQSSQKQSQSSQSQSQQQSSQQNIKPLQSTQSPSQQALQNNQLAQDSSSLKQQMMQEMQKEQQMKDQFQKNLAQNQEFQKMHQELMKQGFNVTGSNLNPTTNNSGSFEVQYQDKDGHKATLKGNMENGTMKDLEKFTPQDQQKLMDALKQDPRFQKFQRQLAKQV